MATNKFQDWQGLQAVFDTPTDGASNSIAVANRVWDPVNLVWVSETQSGGGASGSVTQGTVPWQTSVNTDTYSAASGSTSSSGNTTIHTPSAGKATRLFYVALSADGANSAPVAAYIKYGGGSALYTVSLVPGAIFSRNIGAGKYYLGGATNDPLVLNLSTAQTVYWSIEYLDV